MPKQTNEVIGYVVVNHRHGFYVAHNPELGNFTSDDQPVPVSRGDAFRRLGAFLDANPGENHNLYEVEPVYREATPVESAADELGGLLEQLCARHGVRIGLSREQINAQLQKELQALEAGDVSFLYAGLPRR